MRTISKRFLQLDARRVVGVRAALAGAFLLAAVAVNAGSPGPDLVLSLKLEKSIYFPTEQITVTLKVANRSVELTRLNFRTSQRYDLSVEDAAGRVLWRWSEGRFFLQAIEEVALKPGSPGLKFRAKITAPSKRGRYILRGQVTSIGPPLSDFVTFDVR